MGITAKTLSTLEDGTDLGIIGLEPGTGRAASERTRPMAATWNVVHCQGSSRLDLALPIHRGL